MWFLIGLATINPLRSFGARRGAFRIFDRYRTSNNLFRVGDNHLGKAVFAASPFAEGDMLTFMDLVTYDQISIPKDFLEERAAFLQDGMKVTVESHEGRPIGIALPDQVTLEVVEAEPVVRGQTAASSYKPAMLENGVRVMVPPFIAVGEKVVVDTNELTYVRRAD